MIRLQLLLTSFLSITSVVVAVMAEVISNDISACVDDEDGSGTISIAGTKAVQRLTQAWKNSYDPPTTTNDNDNCPVEIIIQGEDHEDDGNDEDGGDNNPNLLLRGSSSSTSSVRAWPEAAAQVCGIHPIHDDVDIAGMSGPFFFPQATTEDGWNFQCNFDSPRSTILLKVAHEGVSIVTSSSGVARTCLEEHLGGGLSIDQLRWIYSDLPYVRLLQEGVDPSTTIPNSDGDDRTHLWSELHEDCEPVEILLAGMDAASPAHEYFTTVVLEGNEEHIAIQRGMNGTETHHPFANLTDLASYLHDNDGAGISFLHLSDLFSPDLPQEQEGEYGDTEETIWPVPLKNKADDDLIHAEEEAIDSHTYPLSRDVYLGIVNDPTSLKYTRPFLEFGLSERGTAILQETGFWSINKWEKVVMATRLQGGVANSIPMEDIQSCCGPNDGHISMAGSATVFPVANIWSKIYQLGCPTIDITIDGGGSSVGGGRVCANLAKGSPVDIGNMSRQWKSSEGRVRDDGYTYDCIKGDDTRSAVQIDIAYDGMTMIVQKRGIGDECQQLLGGFTVDQLRWMYSNYNEDQLAATGWDPSSVPNGDDDPTTHLWNELDPRCSRQEIRLAGDILNEGTHSNFRKIVFRDYENGEDVDTDRPLGYHQGLGFTLVSYLQRHGDAVSYIGYNYYFDNKEVLSAAPIENLEIGTGEYVLPSVETIGNGQYKPLVRRIFMNLHVDEQSLEDTIPLLQFGFSHPQLAIATGLVPIQGAVLEEMLHRLELQESNMIHTNAGRKDDSSYVDLASSSSRNQDIVVSIMLGIVLLIVLLALCFVIRYRRQ